MNSKSDTNGRDVAKRNRNRKPRSGSKNFRIPNRVVLGIALILVNSGLLLQGIFAGLRVSGVSLIGGI